MTADELQAQEVHALNVANTVWGIVSDKPWDFSQEGSGIVSYPDVNIRMKSIWLEGPTSQPDKTPINDNCGVVHFCHMKDVVDEQGNWTLLPDCGPVKFACHGKFLYSAEPSLSPLS